VPLCKSADGGVAGHLPDGVEILAKQKCRCAQASGCQSRFDSGVPGSYYDNVVIFFYEKLFHVDQICTSATQIRWAKAEREFRDWDLRSADATRR
jgi:hypothetical protein